MSTVAQDRPYETTLIPEQRAAYVGRAAAAAGDPAMLGLPTFILGSVALGLTLTGYVPAAAQAGALPIILATTGLGMLIATLWAARLGQSAVASIFGIFTGFWLSYAVLLLGLGHNWFGVPAADVKDTVSAFLLTWVVGVALLTLVTLRLPLAFTVLLGLVDLALVLVLLGNTQTSAGLTKAGGWVVFLFAALGAYLFAGASSVATGGPALPLGTPVQR
jgi:succinate-acetate transporter protein